ncbi:hypothetical protein NWP96_03785 [Mycoplasmopsis cynos]|nr:hypothetical protein [Mycoplasmopsis cynos]
MYQQEIYLIPYVEIYGVDVDPSFVSRVTDKIMSQIVEWQNRPL